MLIIITPSLVATPESKDYAPYTAHLERGEWIGGENLLLTSILEAITHAYGFFVVHEPSIDDSRPDPTA